MIIYDKFFDVIIYFELNVFLNNVYDFGRRFFLYSCRFVVRCVKSD